MKMTPGCTCTCHNGPHYPCSAPGGCGSTGCGRTNQPRTPRPGDCITCAVYRPDADPRQPHHPPVCDGDRRLLDRHLTEIANLHADLANPEPPIVDRRSYERFIIRDGQPVSLGETWADPLTVFGGVAPINSKSRQPSVSGSRERAIPIQVDRVDLTGHARTGSIGIKTRGDWAAKPDGDPDQIGYLSAATLLDFWTQDVRAALFADHALPPATVDEMAAWLRARLDEVCDRHPDVASFTADLKRLRGALRHAAGEVEPQPERCDGIACGRCDMRLLYRRDDGSGDVECHNPDCRAVYRPDEYHDLLRSLAEASR